MKLRESETDEPTINLTPLIDVVFTLLVFFMLATTFLERERLLGLELPTASAPDRSAASLHEIVINVARDGATWVDGREVRGDELGKLLADTARRDPRTPITVRGDRRTFHEEVVRVLDECMRAGLGNLAVSTRDG